MSTLIEMRAVHNRRPLPNPVRLDVVPPQGTYVFIGGYSKHHLRVEQVVFHDGGGVTLHLEDDDETWA